MTQNNAQAILIVEDEIQIQKLLSYGLQEHGFKSLCASSGEEALRMISTALPACILLDLGLPNMSGIETLREVRRFTNSSAHARK